MGSQARNIAVIVETSNEYARSILRGIHQYQQRNYGWTITLSEHGRHEPDDSFAGSWVGDGVIARVETQIMAEIIKAMGVPTVDVSAARLIRGIPWVETNDKAISELAVQHLLDCGLRNLAFFGDPYYNWSKWRSYYFTVAVKQSGLTPHVYNLPPRKEPIVRWFARRAEIISWLDALPKPVGVFACYDACGQQLLEICRYYKVPVPEDVAVVGVDNDELLCQLSTPPLSSVVPNAEQAGFHAAQLLDRMMDGEVLYSRKHSIDPLGVRKRVSTDILVVEDPHVARAVAYIRKRALENISAEDVCKTVPMSRRVFERRFRAALNRTPHQEIARVRVNAIREFLAETDMTLSEIAEALRIEYPEYLSVFFKKETGKTPMQYRQQARLVNRVVKVSKDTDTQ